MTRVLAMILAGGRGRRMDILCYGRPKPILPFGGRRRIIDFSLSNCINSGIRNVAVLTDYQRSNMATYLKRCLLTGTRFEGFHILEPKTGSYRSTADAVYQNLAYLEKQAADQVLILPSDHVYQMDFRPLLAFHEQVKADLTIAVTSVSAEQAQRFGNIIMDAGGRITRYIEKPDIPRSNLVSMGIFLFNKHVLVECVTEDARRAGSAHGFEHAIIPGMLNQSKVFAHKFSGYWQDIGNIETYYEANMELTRQKPPLRLEDVWPISTEVDLLPPIRRTEQSRLENSLVSPGCVIKGRVENSVLSPGVWVDEQALVRNSVLMANVFIGYHSVVDGCILDEGVNIGKFSYIGFGANPASGAGDVTVLGRGVIVPSHTAIGRNCRVLPHVAPEDFTARSVPSGTIVTPRLEHRTRVVRSEVIDRF